MNDNNNTNKINSSSRPVHVNRQQQQQQQNNKIRIVIVIIISTIRVYNKLHFQKFNMSYVRTIFPNNNSHTNKVAVILQLQCRIQWR